MSAPLTSSLLLLILSLFLQSCAAQAPPPGGPADTTHPKIDTTIPHDRQLNVPKDTRLYFRFDRDIDRASFQQAFSITPYVDGTLKFNWSGHDEVSVVLPATLRDSTTYTAQLSRDLKSRRGNNLATPIRMTFSTGPLIDTGSLSGFLLSPLTGQQVKPSEIYIFAYDISVRHPDTLNPSLTPADLLTQPNDQGLWQFLSMKVGHRYRVFAVGDVYRNHVYDPGVDAFGVPTSDVVLDSVVKSGLYIRMSPVSDTIKPELQDVEVVDSFHVRAHFSEAIDSNDIRPGSFILPGVPILAAFRENPDKKPSQVTLLTAHAFAANGNYTVEVRRDSIHDLAHNPVSDSAFKVSFSAPAALRGAPVPKFSFIGIRDSAVDLSTMPTIPFAFSDALNHDSLAAAITVTDSGGRLVPMRFDWSDDSRFYLKSRDSLMSDVLYTIRMRTSGIRSPIVAIPHDTKDTTFRWRFRTTNVRDFGKISGDISIADSFFAQSPAGALVVQILQPPSRVFRQFVLPHGEHHFLFDQVPAGTFRVRAFFSRSGTPTYEAGSVIPWRYGVSTGEYPKEVVTRARWEMSKIDFEVR